MLQTNLVTDSIEESIGNKLLENVFTKLFYLEGVEDGVLVVELYREVTTRYLKMGAGQFLCDFRRDYHLQKSLAHRKSVLQKKKKAQEKRMKVHIPQIEQDKSHGKRFSHVRLSTLVNNLKAKGLKSLYTKKELQRLCEAYDVRNVSSWNKAKLMATDLVQEINIGPRNNT